MLYGETNMFSYDGKVRYSEVDSNKNLTVTAAVNYLQDTCVLHSESVGAGVDYVNESGRYTLSFFNFPTLFYIDTVSVCSYS